MVIFQFANYFPSIFQRFPAIFGAPVVSPSPDDLKELRHRAQTFRQLLPRPVDLRSGQVWPKKSEFYGDLMVI